MVLSAIVFPTTTLAADPILVQWHLLLDSQTSIPVIKNAELLADIRPAARSVRVEGVGGHIIIDQVRDLADFVVPTTIPMPWRTLSALPW